MLQAVRFVNNRGVEAYCTLMDCMAVGYAIDPTLVKTIKGHVGIETKSGLTLGMTVLDRRHHHVWEELPVIEIGASAAVSYKHIIKGEIYRNYREDERTYCPLLSSWYTGS